MDDISSCVYLHDLPFLCNTLKSLGASLGCFVNSAKTCILTSCNTTSPLPLLHTINPTLSTAISTTIAEFSTRPHPTDKSAPAIPVKLTTGFRLLGHLVGSSTFATKFFTAQVNNVKECITSMTHSITDNKPNSASSPNAFCRNSPTSLRPTSSTTSPRTIQTLTGNNRTDHSHLPLKISLRSFSPLSLPHLPHPATPSSSAN